MIFEIYKKIDPKTFAVHTLVLEIFWEKKIFKMLNDIFEI